MCLRLQLEGDEQKTKPRATDEDKAEWNEEFMFPNVQFSSSLRASIRTTGTFKRSVLGDASIMVDRFFSGGEADETLPLFSDKDQLVS